GDAGTYQASTTGNIHAHATASGQLRRCTGSTLYQQHAEQGWYQRWCQLSARAPAEASRALVLSVTPAFCGVITRQTGGGGVWESNPPIDAQAAMQRFQPLGQRPWGDQG